jgi:hypothetical protein
MAKDLSNWLVEVLPKHDEVASASRVGRGLVRIEREKRPPAIVAVISADPVTLGDLAPIWGMNPHPEFVLNIPNDAGWTGEAIMELESKGLAYGKMYDLYRGLNQDDNLSQYKNPEIYFVERIFNQHWNVFVLERVSDRKYRVIRRNGDDLVVALSDAYEVTADVVRTAHTKQAPFDMLFRTNPYSRVAPRALDVAYNLGISVVNAAELHKVLEP